MANQEELLTRSETGKLAGIVLGHLDPIFDSLERSRVDSLKQLFRNGEADSLKYIAGVAGLCALDDLKIKLKAQMNTGLSAGKELMK